MKNKTSNILQKTIKEINPELYNFIQNLSKCSISLNKVVKPYTILLKKIADSPEFKIFISECQYLAVKSSANNYFWAINDKNLIEQLKTISEDKYTEQIICYYSKNNYLQIKYLLENWTKNNIITNRIPILNSCFNTMHSSLDIEDIANIVIPVITAQITGIAEDIYSIIPDKDRIKEELKVMNKGNDPSEGQITTQYLWELHEGQYAMDCYLVIFKSVLINKGQFKKLTNSDFEKYNKFRNKILHGDKNFLNYGTLENLIRSWLELDLLIKIYSKLREIQENHANLTLQVL